MSKKGCFSDFKTGALSLSATPPKPLPLYLLAILVGLEKTRQDIKSEKDIEKIVWNRIVPMRTNSTKPNQTIGF